MLRSGHCLGTLCVSDPQPRSGLTPTQHETLRDLALLTSDLIEARQLRRMGDVAVRLVDRMAEAVVVVDGTGHVSYANPGAEALFGLSAGEIIGRDMGAIFASGSRHGPFCPGPRGDRQRRAADAGGQHADGGTLPIALTLVAHEDGQGRPGFAAILRDNRLRPEGQQGKGMRHPMPFSVPSSPICPRCSM
jgi:PAS domain S-box-containing protein